MKSFDVLFLPKSLSDYFKRELKAVNIKTELHQILIRLLLIDVVLSILFLALFRRFPVYDNQFNLILDMVSSFFLVFFVGFFVLMILLHVWLSLQKYNRKNKIEDVLADYLQLVSTNIGSGMTIDQSLWYAVRKRFGILSDEIEIVTKKLMSGGDIKEALLDFSEKYDSDILKKSIVLLVEGMESGGKLADLISKISWNIKENQIMKKQLAADTTAYVFFIGFAALIAAPVLFALSHRIIIVMADIMGKIDFGSVVGVSTKIPITNLGTGLDQADFKLFAFISLFVTSVFSSLIIGSVRKGDAKSGIALIPIFILVSFVFFLLASIILTHFFGSIGL